MGRPTRTAVLLPMMIWGLQGYGGGGGSVARQCRDPRGGVVRCDVVWCGALRRVELDPQDMAGCMGSGHACTDWLEAHANACVNPTAPPALWPHSPRCLHTDISKHTHTHTHTHTHACPLPLPRPLSPSLGLHTPTLPLPLFPSLPPSASSSPRPPRPTDQRIALLGAMQSLFEASMYTFVFLWTPALSPRGEKIPHGLVFSCFMTACMVGARGECA